MEKRNPREKSDRAVRPSSDATKILRFRPRPVLTLLALESLPVRQDDRTIERVLLIHPSGQDRGILPQKQPKRGQALGFGVKPKESKKSSLNLKLTEPVEIRDRALR